MLKERIAWTGTPQSGSVLAHQEKIASRVGVANVVAVGRQLRQDVATDEVRKASRARAPDSPMPGEGRKPERPNTPESRLWAAVVGRVHG
jgi:hypothetical protein